MDTTSHVLRNNSISNLLGGYLFALMITKVGAAIGGVVFVALVKYSHIKADKT